MKYNQRRRGWKLLLLARRPLEPRLPLILSCCMQESERDMRLWINQFPLLASFLYCLLLRYVLWIKLIIFMQRSISICTFIGKSLSDFVEKPNSREGWEIAYQTFVVSSGPTPFNAFLIIACKNLLPHCWLMLVKKYPCQEWAHFPT